MWIIALVAASKAETDDTYYSSFPYAENTWSFIFPARSSGSVYESARTAIDILSVKCDGRPVVPMTYGIAKTPNINKLSLKTGTVMYQFSIGRLYCWVNPLNPPSDIKEFTVPQNVRRIEVEYNVRHPGAANSRTMRIIFTATEEPIDKLTLSVN